MTNEPAPPAPRAAAPDGWFSPGRFAALLALLVLAAFPDVLFGLKTFVVRDFGFFAHPNAHFQRGCFWRGEFPLWNPYNDCGVPFLAQWNTMPLYPPALLYLLLPLTWSLNFFCLLHLWFAGLGAYLLARRWTGNDFAAAFAGVAFAFNGLTLNLLMWPSHIATFAWMPWVILAVEPAWREGGRKIFLAALAGAMQMLAGGPETILFTWLLLAGLWVMDLVRAFRSAGLRPGGFVFDSCSIAPGRRPALRCFFRFPLIVLLVAALAAAQLLPFLDLAAHSQREPGFADTRWAMPAWGWANYLVPMAFGSIWNSGVFFQYDQAWTSSYYLGTGALLLALLAAWRARGRRVWLLAFAGAVALAFAFGDQTFLVRELRRLIPQLTMMTYPVKYVLLVTFVVPQLAAFALAGIQKSEVRGQRSGSQSLTSDLRPLTSGLRPLAAVLLALIAAILFCAWRFPFPTDDVRATLFNGLTRAGFLVVSAVLLLALGRMRFAALLLVVVAWLDVFTHEPNQNPVAQPWIYQPGLARAKLAMQPQPALGGSRAMTSAAADNQFMGISMNSPQQNFLVKRLGYFADCNLLDDVPKVGGFFSLLPRECGELHLVLARATNAPQARALDFMAVSQTTAPGKFVDWEARTNFLPLVTAGQKPFFLDDTNALWSLVTPQFDPTKHVFLTEESKARVTVTNASDARVLASHFERERVDITAEAGAPALVVVAQTYYHRWRATLDGNPAPLLRANYAFQAVEIPAGRHEIRLAYEDGGFKAGGVISLAALLVCVVALALRPGKLLYAARAK